MKKIIYTIITATILVFTSCNKDLDQYPSTQISSAAIYANPDNYIKVLAKCYASFVIIGQAKSDNKDFDDGGKNWEYMRAYFNLQEVGTEEIAYTWLDGDHMTNLTYLSWDANDPQVSEMYYRCYYTISLCNEFLKNSTDNAISGFTAQKQSDIKTYRAEARFLRSLAYYHAMDLFGGIPFADENTIGTTTLPKKWEASKIYGFIESELKDCSKNMLDAASCPYGHAPRAAAWMLLSRLYLNAEIYTVKDAEVYAAQAHHFDSCMVYSQKVIGEGYALESDYAKMFNADNNKRVGIGHEIIFPLINNSQSVVSFAIPTYLVCGEVDANVPALADSVGIASAWSMFRIRGEIPALFDMKNDVRAMFYTTGQTQNLDKGITDRNSGYIVLKWSNRTDAGVTASNTASDGADIDFPVFRLADAYLMYAEAAARAKVADLSTALGYVNALRSIRKAALVTESDIKQTVSGIDFKFFLDERGRELYWECVRRTDLIRFGCFTTDTYKWQWKGGVKDGMAVDNKYNIYPIPATEVSANPNLSNADY